MPNFWTKTVQKISESVSGPRTNDKELIKKIEEMKLYEKGLINLKQIVFNFTKYFEKILSFNREITECIFLIYNNNEEFKEFANSLTSVHVDNNKHFQMLINDVNEINKTMSNWDTYYSDVEKLYNKRNEARKIYDHYEDKLEKLENKKEELIKEGKFNEKSVFYEEISRNEEKYLKAKVEYIEIATKTYDTIDNLNNSRFNLVNPVLLQLFFSEMKIYETFSNKYGDYRNLEDNLSEMKEKFLSNSKTKICYNPMAFTKNPHLHEKFLKRNSDKREQQILRNDKKSTNPADPKKFSSGQNKFTSTPPVRVSSHENQPNIKKSIQNIKPIKDNKLEQKPISENNLILDEVFSGILLKNNSNNSKIMEFEFVLPTKTENTYQQNICRNPNFNEDLAKIDNNYDAKSINLRIDTDHSDYNINRSRLDKYPTFHSIIEGDDNKSLSKMTNNNPFNIKDSIENSSVYSENTHFNNLSATNKPNNIFWDFTNMNSNTSQDNMQGSQGKNFIQNHTTNINQTVSNEIDFNELLGTNKNKKTMNPPQNIYNIRTQNRTDNKIDPFEGFY